MSYIFIGLCIYVLWQLCFNFVRCQYRVMYYVRKVYVFCGICPHCKRPMSVTGKGRPICTNLGCDRK